MRRQLKVGIFVLVASILAAAAIFVIGDNRKFWERKVQFRAAFRDVAGLKPGTPVRTGGLDIGTVTSVSHGDSVDDTRVYVTFAVVRGEAARVRRDTVVRVVPKGLLGDKMLELTVSDGTAPPQDPAVLMKTEDPRDMFGSAGELANRAQRVVEKLEPLAASLGDPKFSENIKGSAGSVNEILDAVAHKDSVAHRLLFDTQTAQKLDTALDNFVRASGQLEQLLGDARAVTHQVRTGPGLAHALVYDGDLSKNASGTLAEVHESLRAVRHGNGLAHSLLYGDEHSSHVMANLAAMSDDLRQIVGGIRQGKGTIGALLVDPSVYEDLKSAVGNVERNQVLRALVRYSIKADEQRPHVTVTPPPAASK